jgi:hypothetical protein
MQCCGHCLHAFLTALVLHGKTAGMSYLGGEVPTSPTQGSCRLEVVQPEEHLCSAIK